ncbi:MAG: ribosome small subunit-dependent GTPase A [Candidatus Electrothrix sp. YB6]
MNNIPNNLKDFGFDKWYLEAASQSNPENFEVARVVAVHKDSYTVSNGEVDTAAELIGKILFNASSPVDYPTVGDWVFVSFYDENTFSIIHEILPRKSLLKRKTPGKKVDFQLIAANIDVAFIVQSLNENFNLRRLERYLVMVNESNIRPVVLLSKSDLLSAEDIACRTEEIHKIMPDIRTVPFNNEDESGLRDVIRLIKPNLTYCLLGSSGVGKTTLLNNLLGESRYKTKEVSKRESKGRHATTHRELIKLDSGAMVIDTPGMRELGIFGAETGLDQTFSDIISLSEQCHFNDCTHVAEKGCAVLDAVKQGQLSPDRYHNYLKMTRETTYNEMSYLEKRIKDKQFSKHCKAVMKHRKSRR